MTIAIFGAKYKKKVNAIPIITKEEKRSLFFSADTIQNKISKLYIAKTDNESSFLSNVA